MGVAAACAKSLWQSAGLPVPSEEAMNTALAAAFLPGRWQKIPKTQDHPPLFLDGGHNPHAIKALVENIPAKPATIIFACMADKDWQPGLAMLLKAFPDAAFLLPALNNPRAEDCRVIKEWLKNRISIKSASQIETFTGKESVKAALSAAFRIAPDKTCLVCGSFFLLAEIYAAHPGYLLPPETRCSPFP